MFLFHYHVLLIIEEWNSHFLSVLVIGHVMEVKWVVTNIFAHHVEYLAILKEQKKIILIKDVMINREPVEKRFKYLTIQIG